MGSETQVRFMQDALKRSTEPREHIETAGKLLRTIKGNLVQRKKRTAEKEAAAHAAAAAAAAAAGGNPNVYALPVGPIGPGAGKENMNGGGDAVVGPKGGTGPEGRERDLP